MKIMHPEFFKAMACFAGAGVSYSCKFLGSMAPSGLETGIDGLSKIGTIGCLIFAVRYLNAERIKESAKREQDAKRWEEKWDKEHAENLAAREADRETREKLQDAIRSLSESVKKDR